jgi:lipoprotein-anchoring transpeptidase ErfK/SrfK
MCPDHATLLIDTASNEESGNDVHRVLGHVVVGKYGTLGYGRREDVNVATPSAELQRGFMLGFTQIAGSGDTAALLTTHGLWIPTHDVQLLTPSAFEGSVVDGELDIAWVFTKRAQVYSAPDIRHQPAVSIDRLTRVAVEGQQQRPSGLWVKFSGGWLKAADLRMPELQQPPAATGPDERWIDVDTRSQTLVAYVGQRPVYATLVSTGKGKPGSDQATPLGVHRVWIKLLRSDMDNLESADAQSAYAVEAVPHVMFFESGYGIHGTYWHDEFGLPKSHGCVNVSPADAEWLFQFAGPHLPRGWSAVFPIALEPGTVVRVR